MPTLKAKLGVLALALLIIIGVAYWLLFSSPVGRGDTQTFVVPKGVGSVAEKLKTEGFVRSSFGFLFAQSLEGSQGVPGGYDISKAMSVWEVARILGGEPRLRWVTIPEGLRKEEIAEILARELRWSTSTKKAWIEKDTVKKDYTEGVFFPETYLLPVNESGAVIADRLVAKFNEKFAPFASKFSADNVKWTTAVKIASLVQREAGGKADMQIVAGIIWNRLLQGMKLDIDATLQYARGNTGSGWWAPLTTKEKAIDSPYNTYKYKGLPPTPISNPGLAAIEATLKPEKTTCLFYLHDKDGVIHCSATYEGHKRNIQLYL